MKQRWTGLLLRCCAAAALALLGGAGAAGAIQPPRVATGVPSPYGPDGPPFYAGPPPPLGNPSTPHTARALEAAQTHALLTAAPQQLRRGLSDTVLIADSGPVVQADAVRRTAASGARVVRITVHWSKTVDAVPPPGFDATDPASPSYHWAMIDAAVRSTVAAGLEPLLVSYNAPRFAEAAGRWHFAPSGTWSPDPLAFGKFAAALARRYSGTFADPLIAGARLPRVHLFQAWNEPNLPTYLEPQWVPAGGRWHPFAPTEYRALLNSFYAAVKGVDPTDTVASAGIAPAGESVDGAGRMAPVRFVHSLLCLRPPPSLRPEPCSDPAHFDAFAFHPLSIADPDRPAISALDVGISDVAKVTEPLRQAARLHTDAAPAPELWITEINWDSPTVPVRLQAHWISRALHRLWVAGADLVDWQFLADPTLLFFNTAGPIDLKRHQAGLYRGQRPKAFLRGYSFPFDPIRSDAAHVVIWGMPPPGARASVGVQIAHGGTWTTIATLPVQRSGVVGGTLTLRGAAQLRLTAVGLYSGRWDVGR